MWLNKPVNKIFFNELFQLAINNNWNQIKVHSSEVYATNSTNTFIQGFNIAEIDNSKSGYLMSHQITLWNKKFLLQQLYKNENPWRNEKRGTRRMKRANPLIHQVDYFAENGKPAINENKNPTGRSEYFTVSVNSLLNDNVLPFITELSTGNTIEKNYAKELFKHFENEITHDGKPQPRKDDLIKRFFNYIRKVFGL